MFAKTAPDTEKGKVPYAQDNFQENNRGIVKVHVRFYIKTPEVKNPSTLKRKMYITSKFKPNTF